MPELAAMSDAWLAEKNTGEKRFSSAISTSATSRNFDCAWCAAAAPSSPSPTCGAAATSELSVDLMRYDDDGAEGRHRFPADRVHAVGQGARAIQWFNLGMAPLSGLEEHALAPAWHKLGPLVQRYGEMFYNFEGLRKFKEKFVPVWRPRYLAAPDGLATAGRIARCHDADFRRRAARC